MSRNWKAWVGIQEQSNYSDEIEGIKAGLYDFANDLLDLRRALEDINKKHHDDLIGQHGGKTTQDLVFALEMAREVASTAEWALGSSDYFPDNRIAGSMPIIDKLVHAMTVKVNNILNNPSQMSALSKMALFEALQASPELAEKFGVSPEQLQAAQGVIDAKLETVRADREAAAEDPSNPAPADISDREFAMYALHDRECVAMKDILESVKDSVEAQHLKINGLCSELAGKAQKAEMYRNF